MSIDTLLFWLRSQRRVLLRMLCLHLHWFRHIFAFPLDDFCEPFVAQACAVSFLRICGFSSSLPLSRRTAPYHGGQKRRWDRSLLTLAKTFVSCMTYPGEGTCSATLGWGVLYTASGLFVCYVPPSLVRFLSGGSTRS